MTELEASQADLLTKYQRILDKNGITETVERVEVTTPSLKGEHFASVCSYVKLHFESGRPPRQLFVKQMPTNEMHQKFLKEARLFEKEAEFFETMLPAMRAYYTKHGGKSEKKPLDYFPTCLYTDETQLIFENLVAGHGYYLVPKVERQNLEQVEFTLKNLAQFHAIGYCMVAEAGGKEELLEKYPFLFETLYVEENPMLQGMFETGLVTACDLLRNNKVTGGEKVLEGLSGYLGKLAPLVCNMAGPKGDHLFNVVNHGDCWTNNMLFVDDPTTGNVKHQVFVDLQVIRVASPTVDILYYLCTSMPTPLRRKNLTRLLTLYFNTLKTEIGRLGGKFPHTFDQLMEEIRSKFAYGLFININFTIVVEIMATVDFSKIPTDGDPAEYFNKVVSDWVAAHPEKAEENSKELVVLWEEFEEVTGKA